MKSIAEQMKNNTVAVIGAGTMGHGIAQVFAIAGFHVTLHDSNPDVLEKSRAHIRNNLELAAAHGLLQAQSSTVLERIDPAATVAEAVAQADFVIEAVLEKLEVKNAVLGAIAKHMPAHAIIASNTSSFRVAQLAPYLDCPERFLITHWWNPPHIIPLVEVVRGELTADDTIELTSALLRRAGKVPALVQQDVNGFVGNRLQHALRREALAIVAAGIASAEDVDRIARLSFGLRMPIIGPLETVDLAGLDLTLAIHSHLLADLDRSTEPSPLVREKVERGELGVKTGKGFFEWPPSKVAETIQQRDEALLTLLTWLNQHGFVE